MKTRPTEFYRCVEVFVKKDNRTKYLEMQLGSQSKRAREPKDERRVRNGEGEGREGRVEMP